MPPRRKFHLVMLLWLVGGGAILFLTPGPPRNAVLVFVPLGAILGIWSMNIRCPSCGRPVGYIGQGIWSPFVPRKCGDCGRDLTVSRMHLQS